NAKNGRRPTNSHDHRVGRAVAMADAPLVAGTVTLMARMGSLSLSPGRARREGEDHDDSRTGCQTARTRAARRDPGHPEFTYLTFAPTTLSHCLVMTSFAFACWSSVGKTALSYASAGGSLARRSPG